MWRLSIVFWKCTNVRVRFFICVYFVSAIYIVINCVYLAGYCKFEREIINHIYRELLVQLKQGNWCKKNIIVSMCSWFDFSLRTRLASRARFALARFIAENLTLSILLNKCSKEHIIHDYRNYIWAKVLQSETWDRV